MYEAYGLPEAVLQYRETARPTPKANEVLVKIHAASVNAADGMLVAGSPFMVRMMYGLLKPRNRIPGADIAGRIEAVGAAVQGFAVGDAVFADLSGCGSGGFAEYVCVPEKVLAKKPAGISFEQAAAVPMAAVTALQALRDHGGLQPGQRVLINGASGGVGTFAVQIARALGAEVTAVCSAGKAAGVRALGATRVIDYAREDFTQSTERYDLILGINGYHPIGHYKRVLRPGGTYIGVGGTMTQIFQAMLLGPLVSRGKGQKLASMTAHVSADDLAFLAGLLEAGQVVPVIDRCYPLAEVPQALHYVMQKHAQGKVVITVAAGA